MAETELQVVETSDLRDLVIARAPAIVLEEAQLAAKALQQVIAGKKNPVMFNGQQYLEFEDWQTVGKFYGVTAKIVENSTRLVQIGEVAGYEARAVVIRLSDGMEISAAESMCLSDEVNWSKKPLFQLRSMAQTRACAKALRNVLAWVVVLAGYRPTPAEELPADGSTLSSVPPPPAASKSGARAMKAKFASTCPGCETEIVAGSDIVYVTETKKAWHPDCLPT